ncbi:MAG: isopentenyl phosphate kinase [Candidatus Aenigmatarchaeota archaeon]
MKDTIILKIGGSVITDKFSDTPKVDLKNLKRISKEVASSYDRDKMSLVIVHGVGSYGHVIVKKTGIHKGIERNEQLNDFAETQRLQNELNCIVTKYLIEAGLPAFPCQASAFAVMDSGRLVKMDTSAIEGLVSMGMIPVLYGVPAYDRKQKCSILSGDQIAPFLAVRLKAKKIIHGTNVDGVFTSDPNKNHDSKIIPRINSGNIDKVKEWLTGSTATDVTGGMFGKINELLNIGVKSQIVNALVENNIVRVMNGEEIGTIIEM